MKIIWTFTLLMIPGVVSSMSVTGYSGEGVTIKCKYDKGYTENKKYICKEQGSVCRDRIRTNEKDKLVKNVRFSLYDDTSSAVFTVTIRDLIKLDSGTYQCGVDIKSGTDPRTEVNLKVLTDEDECETRSPCGDNAQCFNTHGSYYCTCDKGFKSDPPNFTASTGQCVGTRGVYLINYDYYDYYD